MALPSSPAYLMSHSHPHPHPLSSHFSSFSDSRNSDVGSYGDWQSKISIRRKRRRFRDDKEVDHQHDDHVRSFSQSSHRFSSSSGVGVFSSQLASIELIPISLSLTLTHLPTPTHKTGTGVASFRDHFLWNIHSPIRPLDFLRRTLLDAGMDTKLWLKPLFDAFNQQIEEAKLKKLHTNITKENDVEVNEIVAPLMDTEMHLNKPKVVKDESFVQIELDVVDHDRRLEDSFLWPTSSSAVSDPRQFADSYISDLGLPAEFAVKVAQSIRDQLKLHELNQPMPPKRFGHKHKPIDLALPLFRSQREAAQYTHRYSEGLTVRHHIEVVQRPPPPYIAQFVPPSHRHAIYAGTILDSRSMTIHPTETNSNTNAPSDEQDEEIGRYELVEANLNTIRIRKEHSQSNQPSI